MAPGGKARAGTARPAAEDGGAEAAPAADASVQPNGPALGALDDTLGFHLRLAQDASFRAFTRKAGDDRLRPGWFAVLSVIGANPGITPRELSRAVGRDKSSITPVLKDLLKARHILRLPSESDGRSYSIRLTPEGEETLARILEPAAEHDRTLDAIVGEHKPLMLALLRRIWTELG
jgi:DNA-binding MarR family transcriptional regulator